MGNNHLPLIISKEIKLIDALKAMGSQCDEYYYLPWCFKERSDGSLEVVKATALPESVKRLFDF